MSTSTVQKSIEYWNKKSFNEYKDFLEKAIKLNNKSSIFMYTHLDNFLAKYKSSLGYDGYPFLEKLFYISLELKRYETANQIINSIYKDFGGEKKIIRMIAEKNELDPKSDISLSLEKYKQLMLFNQEDKESIKRYLMFMKFNLKTEDIKGYIDKWNEYLKVYMDDEEAWNELAEVYLMCNNYSKAIYCLEELLLHNPMNYLTYMKIGDIYASLGNTDACKNGLKYYSQAALITPTPKAFLGIAHCVNCIYKVEKKLDDQTKALVRIAKTQIKNMYAISPFDDFGIEMVYDLP